MSNYVKATDFASKDALTTGDPLKIIKGTEINTEFNNIQTAVATKADLASPALTGNPTAPTQAQGNSSTRIATTAFVQGEITANSASVAITGGTITGVTISGLATDLAVSDGGTGKSTLAVNNVLLGNGTNPIQEVAPGTSGNVLSSNGTTWASSAPTNIGVGQSWTDVTATRVNNTNYTNSTGKPIMVFARALADVSGTISITIDGLLVARSGWGTAPSNTSPGISIIVPNGSTYNVNSTTGIALWTELR